ncbi:unnamed protein product [Microthlaspi erraticum]|uniref:Ubiquitin-like protease family profile domain-containing protein n=2 Tax=Microthlaspi erraticum TaxID=1685480 RepID=A0A6D2KTT2_9BRAS|nr:unnamed protein product [Microthlaspi erraticum]
MGRFSWLTEGSSSSDQLATRSSARVVSKDDEDVSSHTSRDISYGIPSRCYCGFLTPLKMMDHTDEHPGRIFFGCKNYKLGFPHLMKWWDEAMMEEFLQLKWAFDNPRFGFPQPETEERKTLLLTEAELTDLKNQVLKMKRLRRLTGDFVVSPDYTTAVSPAYTTAVSADYTTRCLRQLHNPLSPPDVKADIPRRFYTKGGDPDAGKSISRCSKNTKLFDSLRKLLTDDEWNEISDSRIGIFLKFRDLQFEWASRIAHAMLCFQVVCKKKYEIWSAVGANPIRFSLHEFSAITGLNCEYVENLETPDAPATDAVCEFWERLGVNVEVGPSIDQLAEACEWAGEWPREDKLRLGYLAIYAGFIQARRSAAETPVKLARLVLDLEKFEEYPWGRVCFLQLIKSIKGVDLEKSGYVLEGFIEVLQIWAFESMPNFAEKYGAPLPSKPSPPLLAYKGIQGKRYIVEAMLKQVVGGGGSQDWDEEGVLVSNHPRVDVKPPIKVEASFTDSKKRPRPTPPSNYDDIEETLQRLISDCTRTLSADLKAGFQKYDRQLAALTSTVAGMERSVKQLMDVRLQEQRRSDDPSPKKDETGEEDETGAKEDVTGAKEAKTAQPVSTDPSPKSLNSSKVQDKQPKRRSILSDNRDDSSIAYVKTYVPSKEECLADIRKNQKFKDLIRNKKQRLEVYNPYMPEDKNVRKELTAFLKSTAGYPKLDKDKFPVWYWWWELITQPQWLSDSHMDAVINLMRLRMKEQPHSFRSDRLVSSIVVLVCFGRQSMTISRSLSLMSLDLGSTSHLTHLTTSKARNQNSARRINDVIPAVWTMKNWTEVEPVAVMMAYMLREMALVEERDNYPFDKFTHERIAGVPEQKGPGDCGVYCLKYIECHATGNAFSASSLCNKNIKAIRSRYACDIFKETDCKGPRIRDWDGLDPFDGRC